MMALGIEGVEDWLEVGPDCHFVYCWLRGAKRMADLLPPVEG